MAFIKKILLTLFAVSIAFSQNISQNCWRNESCRMRTYPERDWYFAFVEDTIPRRANVAQVRNMLEQHARNRMVERVRTDVISRTSMETRSIQQTQDGITRETLNIDFEMTSESTAGATVVNSFVDSYHNPKTNKIYAFAAVKRADLADFYASKIEFTLNEAQRNLELSKQLLELDRKREAREKLNESRKLIDLTNNHRTLLVIVDTQNGIKRSQGERINKLLNDIAVFLTEIKASDVVMLFIDGTQNIVVSGLQTILSENNVIITENKEEASLILRIEAETCNEISDGNFHFAYACVRIVLANTKTGRNELTINFTGQKQGALNARNAGERALRSVVPDVWARIKDKIFENLQLQ